MNSILLKVSTNWCWTRTFALLIPVCLFVAGCSCFHKVKPASQTAPHVTVLGDSFDAFKKEFNADPSKPRVLALFSPTCGGCIYGAKALQHEARKLPQVVGQAEVMIVWVAMLDSDNEREARMAAKRFDFPGVRHFYDGERRIGSRLMAEQFPNAVRDALEILPRDHEMREMLECERICRPRKCPCGTPS